MGQVPLALELVAHTELSLAHSELSWMALELELVVLGIPGKSSSHL
jgi:hypothetical protein